MKVFVVHYKKLLERKVNILEQLKKNNITDYEFIEIDRDEIQNYDISIFNDGYSNSQIAISLSHFYAYREIAEKHNYALILEDDVILSDNFMEKLHKYMEQLPNKYDMLFLGDGCNLHIDKKKIKTKQLVYHKSNEPNIGYGATRCTDSYIVSKKCCIKIVEYIKNIRKYMPVKLNIPIDWFLNVVAYQLELNIFWAEPTIATQGTQNGLYKSSH